jgi:hypothetical protein
MFSSAASFNDGPSSSLQRWLFYIALFFIVIGTISIAVGSLMPAYTDPAAAERIQSGSECEPGVPNKNGNSRCDSQVWHRSMDSLRTTKWRLIDVGGGLLASALSIFVFAKWNGRKSWKEMVTPKRSLSIVALVALAWLMQIPAFMLFFAAEVTVRDCCPWWADSVAIPIFRTDAVVLLLFLPFVAVWLIFVVGAQLPVTVFRNVPGRPIINILWTGAAVLLCVPIVLYLINAILDGPVLMVPFLWLALWLALCARAAALSRHLPEPEVLQA